MTIHLAFAFDIGDEIDLDRARQILQGEPGQLPRRRRTPESIGYRPAPIRVRARAGRHSLAGRVVVPRCSPRGELTLFDFGAISLAVRFPVAQRRPAALLAAGRPARRAGPADRGRPPASRALARADPAGGLRLRRQRR